MSVVRQTKIDWLSYTDKFHDLSEVCEQWFKYLGEPVSGIGRYGYKDCFNSDGLTVMYNGGEARGNTIFTDISGKGTNYLYQQDFKLEDFIRDELTQHPYYHPTRIDSAHDYFADDEADFFPFEEMIKAFDEYRFISKIHKNNRSCTITRGSLAESTDGTPAATLYFGSPSSEIRLRVYNKLAEQKAKNKNNPLLPDVFEGKPIKQWLRFELQMRGNCAIAFSMKLAMFPITECFLDSLNKYIRFVDSYISNDISRSPVCEWWEKFVDTNVLIPNYVNNRGTTIESMNRYVKSASQALYTFIQVFGKDALDEVIATAGECLSKKYQIIINISEQFRRYQLLE